VNILARFSVIPVQAGLYKIFPFSTFGSKSGVKLPTKQLLKVSFVHSLKFEK